MRDIELRGYQVRIRRLLSEDNPALISLDGEAMAKEGNYAGADGLEALPSFGAAPRATLALLEPLGQSELRRRGHFEGYGPVTLEGLVHYLCSYDQQHLACLQWLLGAFTSR